MYRSRTSAYYSRNDSYSRSYNAECAEGEGRLPRTRAAAYLGLSTAAFDAGRLAAGYVATEWHHVGKYASRVKYYDCEELASSPEFWAGAAAVYKSAKKRTEVLATHVRMAAEREAAAKSLRIEQFRAKLIRQRDCTRPKPRHKHHGAGWDAYMAAYYARMGCPYSAGQSLPMIRRGDFATLENRAKLRISERAAKESKKAAAESRLAEERERDRVIVAGIALDSLRDLSRQQRRLHLYAAGITANARILDLVDAAIKGNCV